MFKNHIPKIKKILIIVICLCLVTAMILILSKSNNLEKTSSKLNLKVKDKIIRVDIVKSAAEKAQGLSVYSSIFDDEGMVFEFNPKQKPSFWMKDMKFSIDIIWISDGAIVGISPNLPHNQDGLINYYPPQEVDRVLEVNAGWADKYGIYVGDKAVLVN